MSRKEAFLNLIRSEFPDDRLTFQKRLATFHPESAEEASRLVKLAAQEKQQVFIAGFGNNIDPVGEAFEDLVIVRTDRLNRVLEVNVTDLFIRVGAGFPLREVNINLKPHKLFMPHATLPYVGSAGGAVAVNLSAELDAHDLPIKKYFIQAEIVTPESEVIQPGSVCFKSVSGYDIVKIYSPSWGLLGLLISVTFRVIPQTAAEEFAELKMKAIERQRFLSGLDEANQEADAIYSRKIKAKFDPQAILPIV
jgi:FAD/FMN-containing dehydrogenase